MRKNERMQLILQLLKEYGDISIRDLEKYIPDTSEVTLRRDLQFLADEHKLIRTHGGAKSLNVLSSYVEDIFQNRMLQEEKAKRQIAVKAVSLIKEHDRIFIDSGSTCTYLASQLPDMEYSVLTNGLSSALEMTKLEKPSISIIGGDIFKRSVSTYGAECVAKVENTYFSLAFIGVSGYVADVGFMASTPIDYLMKKRVISQSEKVVILMDDTKIGKSGAVKIASLSDVYAVVSNDSLSSVWAKKWQNEGVIVL